MNSRAVQGNICHMSCNRIAVPPVCTLMSTCSHSHHSRVSIQLNLHADTCVVRSNVLVVHNHEHFVDVYGFNKLARHTNTSTVNVAIAYKDPITHLTVIIMGSVFRVLF